MNIPSISPQIASQQIAAPYGAPSIDGFSVMGDASEVSLDQMMENAFAEFEAQKKEVKKRLKSDLTQTHNVVELQHALTKEHVTVGFVANLAGKMKSAIETLMKQQ